MNDKAIARRDAPTTLVLEGNPEAQLAYAETAAHALMKRVENKKRKIVIGGKQYLEYGDWQTLARFFGATAATEWTRRLEIDGEIKGYECRAVVYQHGDIISAAEAICLRSERNWQKREWHMIMSMAQTRACSKALRNAFGWVAELRGYASTPAEEMTEEDIDEPTKPAVKEKTLGAPSLSGDVGNVPEEGGREDVQTDADVLSVAQAREAQNPAADSSAVTPAIAEAQGRKDRSRGAERKVPPFFAGRLAEHWLRGWDKGTK